MIGGLTGHMLRHISGVPYLHVNRLLVEVQANAGHECAKHA